MRKKAIGIVIKVSVLIIIVIAIFLINEYLKEKKRCSFFATEDNLHYAYDIEGVSVEGGNIVVTGWFIQLKKVNNIETNVDDDKKLGVLVYDLNSEEERDLDGNLKPNRGISADVRIIDRDDINKYFECEYDYSSCGFIAKIEKAKIDFENGEYQVVFKIDDCGKEGIMADCYIINGELIRNNPYEKMELNTVGTDLEKVVEEGVCLYNNKFYNICIFQYNQELYWIVDKKYYYENQDRFYQYIIGTTQFDIIGSNGSYYTNSGTILDFTDGFGDYMVATVSLPLDISITGVDAGCRYNPSGKWIWKKSIRPIYSSIIPNSN